MTSKKGVVMVITEANKWTMGVTEQWPRSNLGFSRNVKNPRNREFGYGRKTSDSNADMGKVNFGDVYKNNRSSNQPHPSGPCTESSLQSVSAFDTEESVMELHAGNGEKGVECRDGGWGKMNRDHGGTGMDDLEDQVVGSLGLKDESGEKSDKTKYQRDKDHRSDKRGQWIMAQRMRRRIACRSDINRLNAPFLAVFELLIPADEEKAFTCARILIVKLMDPVTGISCDICVNNVPTVVNTKLLRDYALMDVRLRQLAFILKHRAKP